MQTFNPSPFRWPFLCILVCLAGCSAKVDCPAGYEGIAPGKFTKVTSAGAVVVVRGEFQFPKNQQGVTITRAYCIGATEVTQGAWQEMMGTNPSYFKECGADCPVEQVSWYDAVEYANAVSRSEALPECYAGSTITGLDCRGYRLPTEAEWEYAARAGKTGASYGGSLIPGATTHPVGKGEPNDWGLYDVIANVAEWTGDRYSEQAGAAMDPAAVDPVGAPTGSARVVRGGSWAAVDLEAPGSDRGFVPHDLRRPEIGFRLARTAP
jgi:formylglycine-generating enzyme required for sulfatase activity